MKKPNKCSFCKGDAQLTSHSYSIGPVLWQVRCPCGMSGAVGYSEDDATILWNRIFVMPDERIIEELNHRQQDFRTDKGT